MLQRQKRATPYVSQSVCRPACRPACLRACLPACMCACMCIRTSVHTCILDLCVRFEEALRLRILQTKALHHCLLSFQTNIILPAATTMPLAMKVKTRFSIAFLSYTLFVPLLSQLPNSVKGRSSNGRRVQTSPPHLTLFKIGEQHLWRLELVCTVDAWKLRKLRNPQEAVSPATRPQSLARRGNFTPSWMPCMVTPTKSKLCR